MAWDFAAEIHSLANYNADDASTTGTSGEVLSVHATQWLTDGAKEVINNLPTSLQKLCTDMVSFTSTAAGSEAETLNTGKIFSVFAGSVNCRLITNTDKYRAEDSGDVLYATSTDPAYYIESNYINVLPTSLSCKYEEVQYPSVAFDDTTISVFPDEAEHLVVLYAAIKACLYQMNVLQTDTAIDTTALDAINTSVDNAVTEIALANGIMDAPPVPPDTPSIATITYSAAVNADASATGVTDSSALVSEQSTVDVSSNAPTYTPPKVTGDTQELTATIVAGAVGTTADFINFEHWFDVLTDMIETNEDIEMASVQLNKISTYIQAYGSAMQNQLHEFNEANVRYQMEFQEAVTKENQDLQVSIANANNRAQEFRQEAQQTTSIDQFNKSQDQALNLANAAKAMEDDISNNNSKVQKFSAEISEYQAEVGEMSARAQGYIGTANAYIASAQGFVAEVNTRIARANQKYTWYDGQYAKLSGEYTRGLTALKDESDVVGGGA